MTSPFADFDAWADEHGYFLEDSPQAFADWLAQRIGVAVTGRECGGDGLVVALPDDPEAA